MFKRQLANPHDLQVQQHCVDCSRRSSNFFCELDDAELREFETLKITKVYPKGTMLFMEGQDSLGIYMVCHGQVKLSTSSPDGKVMILGIAHPGDILGLSAVISNFDHETSAEVMDLCQINFVPKAEFLKFIKRHPAACMSAARQLGRNYYSAHKLICSLGLSDSVFVKLGKLFLSWSGNEQAARGQVRLRNTFTHEEIAEMIGTSRETVTRALRSMRERGLVTLKGSELMIHDHRSLSRSVGEYVDRHAM
jgi:CRP/FNR family cyclic AMP-dependent transcriptional regulator